MYLGLPTFINTLLLIKSCAYAQVKPIKIKIDVTDKILANAKPHFTITAYYLIGFKALLYYMYFICTHMFCCGVFFRLTPTYEL